MEEGPLEEFIERWRTQPLFAQRTAGGRVSWHEQTSAAIAPKRWRQYCADIGAGAMEPLWDRLGELKMPVTVLVGERDAKYLSLGQRMVRLDCDLTLSLRDPLRRPRLCRSRVPAAGGRRNDADRY